MQYWMMRLFLSDRLAGTIFDVPERRPDITREEYLRKAFKERFTFVHRKRNYVYTPFANPGDHLLAGVIAREHTLQIRKAPEAKAEDVPDWDTANVFIDTSGEDDGQKVAMQDVAVVGLPLSVFRSLADHVNAHNASGAWYIAVNSITSDKDFWEAMKTYQGKITEIDLVFAAPNIWGGVSETEEALKKLDKDYAVKETEVKLKNQDGKLNPGTAEDDGVLSSALKYLRRGAGRYSARAGKRIIFNSENKVIKEKPEEDLSIQDAEVAVVSALAKWLMARR